MKKEINFDIKALNGAINVIGKYGGDKARLSELQIKELKRMINFTVNYVIGSRVINKAATKALTSQVIDALQLRGVRDPLAFRGMVSKVVELCILDNLFIAEEMKGFDVTTIRVEMCIDKFLEMFPKSKEVEILEMTTYEVIYTVSGALNYDEVECDHISVEGDFISVYKDSKCIAIYNKEIFIRAILL